MYTGNIGTFCIIIDLLSFWADVHIVTGSLKLFACHLSINIVPAIVADIAPSAAILNQHHSLCV